ncbi:MAG TPA: twin-arginine translocase TatA/TatE family subunit [Dehalococcoidia bacterium]|nr:twin-arginine translocase TatA/TatE family subunit [Dehalococcoidia bacterium]
MLGPLGAPELLIILAILVVLFGASRIAGIGGAIGSAIREFRREVKDDDKKADKPEEKTTTTTSSQNREDRPTTFKH